MENENQENNNQNQAPQESQPVQPAEAPKKEKKKFGFPKLKLPEQAVKQAEAMTMPKLKAPTPKRIKRKLKEYHRVLRITKKPSSEEYKAIVKASALGMAIIGGLGFIIHMIVQAITLLA